jgi:serine/threonine protein phosphatase PrpC
MDKYLVEKSISEGSWADGSTAVVALVVDGVLYVANVGDSEGTLVKKQERLSVVPVTSVHKASDPSEQQRIQELGGKVFFGRVFGMLAVSRAFGDIQYKPPKAEKPYVNAEPAIFRVDLDETCKYLILACDGLWDVCKHEEAAQLVDNWVSQGKNLMETADLLVEYALANESSDNVTVVIVQIHWGDAVPKALETAAQLSSSSTSAVPVTNSSKRPSMLHSNTSQQPPPQVDFEAMAKERTSAPITPGPVIGTVEAPVYLKSLVGVVLCRSYFYMGPSQHYFCTTKLGTQFPLPCWVSFLFLLFLSIN